ncbi:MAG: 3'-5' exonuclease [Planctomycetota bacterium]|nr:3'-5' exonuclease [Planctomycetota bacterium]
MDRPLVVIDTEGAVHRGAPHLVEIGAVRVHAGEALDHFESLVRPQVPIAPEATAEHGISDEDVRDAPEASEALARFAVWVGDDWMVAHNARFDAHAIGFECARHDVEPPRGPMLDSLALARRCLTEAPDHKLATLIEHLGIEVETRHRALPDAVACWQVLEACIERMGGWESIGEADLLKSCGIPAGIEPPPPPKGSRARVRALETARRDGAQVILTYGEPGEAPARLPVRPRLLYRAGDKSYLEAECVLSDILKTYRIDRVQRVEQA